MLGLRVGLPDGTIEDVVGADGYDVRDDGALVCRFDAGPPRTFEASAWSTVSDLGTRLAAEWPPPDLDDLLDQIHDRLCDWGATDRLGPSAHYSAVRLNDLDDFVDAVLAAAGLNPGERTSPSDRIRALSVAWFQLGDDAR